MSQNSTSTNDQSNLDDDLFNESTDLMSSADDSLSDFDLDEFSDNALDSDILLDLDQDTTSSEIDALLAEDTGSESSSSTIESEFGSDAEGDELDDLVSEEIEPLENTNAKNSQKKPLTVSIRRTTRAPEVSPDEQQSAPNDSDDFFGNDGTTEVTELSSESNSENESNLTDEDDFFDNEEASESTPQGDDNHSSKSTDLAEDTVATEPLIGEELDDFSDVDPFSDNDPFGDTSEDTNPFDEEVDDAFSDGESDPFDEEVTPTPTSEDVNPFDEEVDDAFSDGESDPFSEEVTPTPTSEDVNPFDEQVDDAFSDSESDPFSEEATPTPTSEDVNPFDEEVDDAFSDDESDPFGEEAIPTNEDANPFDEEVDDAFSDSESDPFAQENTSVDYQEWNTNSDGTEEADSAIEPPTLSERTEKTAKTTKTSTNDTMSKTNDSQLLSQVNDEISAKPQKSGVGLIGNILLSGLISAGSILAYQEFFVPKDVITEGEMQEALAKATRDISDQMQEQETLITSQIIEELKAKGVIGKKSEVSLPEVAQLASDAKQIAERANTQADENVKMINANKEKHQALALSFGETANGLEGSEARFKKALKALFEIRRKTESENRDLRHALEEQKKESQARDKQNKKLAKEIDDLRSKQTKIRSEINSVRVVTEKLKSDKPQQSNKVQEALGLTATGINVVKGESLPEVEVKGVIGNKILIVNPKTSMIDTYKVGDTLVGYGKIIEIIAQNKTALTDKGLLNKK